MVTGQPYGAARRPADRVPPAPGYRDLDGPVGPDRVLAIAHLPMDPRLRNELITLCYADIADAYEAILGRRQPTWFAYAAHASSEVGERMRSRRLPQGRALRRALGYGNRRVFAEMAVAAATQLAPAEVETDGRPKTSPLHEVGADGRPMLSIGRPIDGRAIISRPAVESALDDDPAKDPWERVRQALNGCYRPLVGEADPDLFASHLLYGNGLLALVEQSRLQHTLAVAFRTAPRRLIRWRGLRSTRTWGAVVPWPWQLRVEDAWVGWLTRHLMRFSLPGFEAAVGRPPPAAGTAPARGTGLATLRRSYPAPPGGVANWLDLGQRFGLMLRVFEHTQGSGAWFDGTGRLHRPPTWAGLAAARAELGRRLPDEPPLPPEPSAALNRALETLRDDDCSAPTDPATLLLLLDDETRRRAAAFYRRFRTQVFVGLLVRSLPETYTGAGGAHVVHETNLLVNDPLVRAVETAAFIDEVFTHIVSAPEAVDATLRRIRKGHEEARTFLMTKRAWDVDTYGVPINAEDVLATGLSFVVPVRELFAAWGVAADEADWQAWLSAWLGVAHWMGAPADQVTRNGKAPTWAEAEEVVAAVRWRHRGRTLAGVRLTEALLEGVRDAFPGPLRWVPNALFDAYGDPAVNRILLVPPSAAAPVARLFGRALAALPAPVQAPALKVLDVVATPVRRALMDTRRERTTDNWPVAAPRRRPGPVPPGPATA